MWTPKLYYLQDNFRGYGYADSPKLARAITRFNGMCRLLGLLFSFYSVNGGCRQDAGETMIVTVRFGSGRLRDPFARLL